MSTALRRVPTLLAAGVLAVALTGAPTGTSATAEGSDQSSPLAQRPAPPKTPVAVGRGGAVSSVDPYASQIGLDVLADGGNAVDAAVATAAALGVTEPFSAGIGGGGYFVYYDAKSGRVRTIDGRETAPAGIEQDAFIDPATGEPYPFTPDLVTSGVSVGVPGTPATWDEALDRWGKLSLRKALAPAARLAQRGFVVDETFNLQTSENEQRFRTFTPTIDLYLEDGVPEVGSTFRNPDLARTYRLLGERGTDWLYRGGLAEEIAATVQEPPVSGETDLPAPPGSMTPRDLKRYRALLQRPTRLSYEGYDVFGMAPSSSGGTTVGESLNILEQAGVHHMEEPDALHHYLEATALAFADRGAYVGDPAYVDVPTRALLDDDFAAERSCEIDPDTAATKPVPAGDVTSYDGECDATDDEGRTDPDTENLSTTHLTTADRWGNVVAYTLTIEQTGGSGIVVPGRGFLLNNELTDFSTEYDEADPNRIQPGKRPRSSMSPTIVLRDGRPFLALGSPGGSTIITTVLQVLLNRLDLGMRLPAAVAAPRASQRNTASVTAEQAFIDAWGATLEEYGHTFTVAGPPGSSASQIGAVAAIEIRPRGRMIAAAEPVRRGGGAAYVVRPR
ncbi:gamma-glutamyltransferase [Nocardioides silvaticus]|uniref:Glutathione hydrolase proenzyme n=1 Tax=Nocardioides silvaticus TaxID=2201891 RepID=A0A316TG00_9ACTN|nr:gamma-glutamyltransferase [Nocardioides silvaticus]PWN01284.1 gamma-glutamyltransferase [Nocardioides silvaticus]